MSAEAPVPWIGTVMWRPEEGGFPLEVTPEATAQDPLGQIVRYVWVLQKQSSYHYFFWASSESRENTVAKTFGQPGRYRVRAIDDVNRAATSE